MFSYSPSLVQRYVEAQCCIASNDYKGDTLLLIWNLPV